MLIDISTIPSTDALIKHYPFNNLYNLIPGYGYQMGISFAFSKDGEIWYTWQPETRTWVILNETDSVYVKGIHNKDLYNITWDDFKHFWGSTLFETVQLRILFEDSCSHERNIINNCSLINMANSTECNTQEECPDPINTSIQGGTYQSHFGLSTAYFNKHLFIVTMDTLNNTLSYSTKIVEYENTKCSDWNEVNFINPTSLNINAEFFGRDISISDNGLIMAVSAFDLTIDKEVVYILKRIDTVSPWIISETITTPLNNGYGFGTSVSLSGDGLVIAIGTPYTKSGHVFIYRRTSVELNFNFESALVNVFIDPLGDFSSSGTLITGLFGFDVSLNYTGEVLVVSNPQDNTIQKNSGKIITYKYDPLINIGYTIDDVVANIYRENTPDEITSSQVYSNYALIDNTLAPNSIQDEYFGSALSINQTGTIMVCSAPYKNNGSVYLYTRTDIDSAWVYTSNIDELLIEGDHYGDSITIYDQNIKDTDDTLIFIGAPFKDLLINNILTFDKGIIYIKSRNEL